MNRQARLAGLFCLSSIVSWAVIAYSHPQDNSAARLSFEVASIKANKSGAGSSSWGCHMAGSQIDGIPRGRCVFRNVLARTVIAVAYDIDAVWASDYISGGPGWIAADRYDVEAKAENDDATTSELKLMLQTFLADRLKLNVREATKDVQGYALVVASGGPKAKPATGNSRRGMASGPFPMPWWAGNDVSMARAADYLSKVLRKPVVDKTGITEHYDFRISWDVDDVEEGAVPRELFGPHFFTAIQEQLGLKLESAKAPARFLIIDHVERPTDN